MFFASNSAQNCQKLRSLGASLPVIALYFSFCSFMLLISCKKLCNSSSGVNSSGFQFFFSISSIFNQSKTYFSQDNQLKGDWCSHKQSNKSLRCLPVTFLDIHRIYGLDHRSIHTILSFWHSNDHKRPFRISYFHRSTKEWLQPQLLPFLDLLQSKQLPLHAKVPVLLILHDYIFCSIFLIINIISLPCSESLDL